MRRGLVFSLIALLMFTSIIIAGVSVNLRLNDEKRVISRIIPSRVLRDIYQSVSIDVSNLYKSHFNNGLISSELMINPNLTGYSLFVSDYLPGYDVSIIDNGFRVYANNSVISYNNDLSIVNASSAGLIVINLSSNPVSVITDWVWESNGVFINLSVKYLNGSEILFNGSASGFINPSRFNTIKLETSNGVINLTAHEWVLINTTEPINISLGYYEKPVLTSLIASIESNIINMSKVYNISLR